jgi:hypothetical protein
MPILISEYIINARSYSPKYSDHPIVNDAIDRLSREICVGGNSKRKAHLKYFFLDLCARYKESPQGWIFYSRDPNYYTLQPQYYQFGIRFKPMIWIADKLKSYGFVESIPGFYDRDTGKAFRTRIRATPQLINYFADIPASELKENFHRFEGIRLRVRTERLIKGKLVKFNKYLRYPDNDYLIYIRNQVLFINEQLSLSHLDLFQLNSEGFETLDSDSTELRINLNRKSLHRVFNENFDRGGRFYGGWWQNVPEELRDHILIDSEPTVELDYKGFHIALLYALEGIDYYAQDGADPYVVEGWDRSSVKLLLQVLLNSKNRQEAIGGFIDDRRKKGLPTFTRTEIIRLLDKFETMHAPIAKYFNAGEGVRLQNLDSRIAELVIRECMQNGIIDLEAAERHEIIRHKFLVLPVHDSFRVKARYKEYLRRAMIQAIESIGQELNYLEDRLFYHYTSRIHESTLIDIQDLPNDSAYQNRKALFQAGELLPDIKLLRKHDPRTHKSFYKIDDTL